jgi:hypothetical protein
LIITGPLLKDEALLFIEVVNDEVEEFERHAAPHSLAFAWLIEATGEVSILKLIQTFFVENCRSSFK